MSSVSETNNGIFDNGLLIDIKPTNPPRKNGQKMAWTTESDISDLLPTISGETLAPPALEKFLRERLAAARPELLGLGLFVEDIGCSLVADGNHRHRRVLGRYAERRAHLVGIEATHLVHSESEGDCLQRQTHARSAGVMLRPAVGLARGAEDRAGAGEHQQRHILHPFLVVLRQAVECFLETFRVAVAVPDQVAPWLIAVAGRCPAPGLQQCSQLVARYRALRIESARTPAAREQ